MVLYNKQLHIRGKMDACINLPVEYKVFGFEVGKKGTPHIQGYLYHNDRISMKQLKKSIPRAHLEKGKGVAATEL